MKRMQKASQGFTLVELVMVIVIIGILAAVAMPKFFDLTKEAEQAAVSGLAGSINTGMTVNFAAAKLKKSGSKTISDCEDAWDVIESSDSSKYDITGGGVSDGGTVTCTIKKDGDDSISATFTAVGATGTP